MGADQTRSEASRWHSPTDGEEGKAVKATLPAFFFPNLFRSGQLRDIHQPCQLSLRCPIPVVIRNGEGTVRARAGAFLFSTFSYEHDERACSQMLAELKDLGEKGLFSPGEIKQIIKKRTAFETALVRRIPNKNDYLRYAAYEMGLEALRRKRVTRLSTSATPFLSLSRQ